jgi:hypothetical protein
VYIQESIVGFLEVAACRLLQIPVVQEVNEWWPSEQNCSRLTKWLYRGPMFSLPTGVLAISKGIEERVRRTAPQRDWNIGRLPILADLAQGDCLPAGVTESAGTAFVWSGEAEGYVEDVLFLLRCTAIVNAHGTRCQLVVTGKISEAARSRFDTYASSLKLPEGALRFTGYIDRPTLLSLYRTAAALLAPLWNNERSLTRYPNKLAEYLASGRPVITCAVGEVADLLTDQTNAYVAIPGDMQDFAAKMYQVIADPTKAGAIGANGRSVCEERLDYRVHARHLAAFFNHCITEGGRTSQAEASTVRRETVGFGHHRK